MKLIINLKLLRFSINVRITAFRPFERPYQNLYIKILQLMLLIHLNLNYLQNFADYKTRFALFNDIKIIKFDLLFIK